MQEISNRSYEFLERFVRLSFLKGLNTAAACREFGISRSVLYDIRSGKREVTAKMEARLAKIEQLPENRLELAANSRESAIPDNMSEIAPSWDSLLSLQEDPEAWRAAYDQIVNQAGVDLFQIAKATDNLVRRAKIALPALARVDSQKSRDLEDAIAKVQSATSDANHFTNLFHVLGELLYAIPAWLEIVNKEKDGR